MITDVYFTVGALQYARQRAAAGWPTFFYRTDHFNPAQFPAAQLLQGATHANEYPYMNGQFAMGKFDFTEEDRLHRELLVEALFNVAAKG